MIRSMYAGVTGLRNHQLKMDVLSNNISNVNTYGYKTARATFSDMFSQNLSSATAANAAGTLGGINARQVGLGSMSSTIDVVHSVGAFQGTDRTLDLMIMDEGFFTVSDGADLYYTRAGNLYLDSFGYLVVAGGQYIQGIMLIDAEPFANEDLMEASVIERIGGDEDIKWEQMDTYDEMMETYRTESTGLPIYGARDPESGEYLDSFIPDSVGRIVIPTYYRQISIDESGVVKGLNEQGEAVEIAVLMTATFMNTGGLEKLGDNLYRESSNSGTPGYSFPGVGPSGSLKAGGLEMSNVDLAAEFTTMIVTQRGYQANSRIITVSDTLLEELINLKR
ncbi:MAG: flagellar hook-basal body complex protein [Oscillospiraceae bacterium]|nr:flagellar hook-basal body complex protein [Oscillospiraceae bacterium]